ncbi:BACON domain-containing protein [Streptomyces sp. SP18CS02]|uniref:BACON domain-containing protein n=1 Tax=Streptomyces sp. SP18CS02 TaxID=3002531 RepID=UPI003FCE80F2
MTSSRLEPPTHTTGAHRAHHRAPRTGPRTLAHRPPARYEPYLDGLFTYCLSVLCDHDAATAALGDALAVSERQFGRCPAGEAERKAWLYALARWACLRELAARRRGRPGAHTGRPPAVEETPRVPEELAGHRRRELSLLAWPEAAGTTPEQREALELAVRHELAPREVASVLGMDALATRELLSAAACEVERTRAALAVVEAGNCPAVARLTGDHQVLLSATLRRELVRHVDDCPRCRRAAERVGAGGPWPGSSVTPAKLPLVAAPRAETLMAMGHGPRGRASGPRFGRDGFPMDPKDHAARRDRLRARAVTTTVVAAVVAAPVLALWAAYRGAPLTGEAGSAVIASEPDAADGGDRRPGEHYENAGSARDNFAAVPRAAGPGVSVEVVSAGGAAPPGPGRTGPGRITVTAQPSGGATMITLTASGSSPVDWSLWTDAPWLYANRSSGTLEPGQMVTVYVSVDHTREPEGPWSARVGIDPAGAVVELDGRGASRPPASHDPDPAGPTAPPSSQDPDPTAPTPPPAGPTTPPPSSQDPDPGQDPGQEPPPATDPPASEPTP